MIGCGHESWHPDPEFYYKRGGGPMFDMGPYYRHGHDQPAWAACSGCSAPAKSPSRSAPSPASRWRGKVMDVDVTTYVAGTVQYDSGAIGTIFTTFDVQFPRETVPLHRGLRHARARCSCPTPTTSRRNRSSSMRPEEGVTQGDSADVRLSGELPRAGSGRHGQGADHRPRGPLRRAADLSTCWRSSRALKPAPEPAAGRKSAPSTIAPRPWCGRRSREFSTDGRCSACQKDFLTS